MSQRRFPRGCAPGESITWKEQGQVRSGTVIDHAYSDRGRTWSNGFNRWLDDGDLSGWWLWVIPDKPDGTEFQGCVRVRWHERASVAIRCSQPDRQQAA